MTTILCIETSGHTCSVSLGSDGVCIFHRSDNAGQAHSRLLHPFIQDALNHAREQDLSINAVAVSAGPGSYTGLRIGVSAAKGIAYALDIPLLAVETLDLLASTALQHVNNCDALLCPMIDARRMEVYTALYNQQLQTIQPISASIIDHHSFEDTLASTPVCFFGSGAAKCKDVLSSPNALFLETIDTDARYMCGLAQNLYEKNHSVDVAYFAPHYLKDFVATRQHNKVLDRTSR